MAAMPLGRKKNARAGAASKAQGNGKLASAVVASDAFQAAENTFVHDLPELLRLRNAARQWVAYAGARRIGFGRTKTQLYQRCLELGLARGTFMVASIEALTPLDAGSLPDV